MKQGMDESMEWSENPEIDVEKMEASAMESFERLEIRDREARGGPGTGEEGGVDRPMGGC